MKKIKVGISTDLVMDLLTMSICSAVENKLEQMSGKPCKVSLDNVGYSSWIDGSDFDDDDDFDIDVVDVRVAIKEVWADIFSTQLP